MKCNAVIFKNAIFMLRFKFSVALNIFSAKSDSNYSTVQSFVALKSHFRLIVTSVI